MTNTISSYKIGKHEIQHLEGQQLEQMQHNSSGIYLYCVIIMIIIIML